MKRSRSSNQTKRKKGNQKYAWHFSVGKLLRRPASDEWAGKGRLHLLEKCIRMKEVEDGKGRRILRKHRLTAGKNQVKEPEEKGRV